MTAAKKAAAAAAAAAASQGMTELPFRLCKPLTLDAF